MSDEGWKKSPDGTLALGKVTGWQIGIHSNQGAIRLDYVNSREQASRGEQETCQVTLSIPQMRELAELLLKTSRLLEHQN